MKYYFRQIVLVVATMSCTASALAMAVELTPLPPGRADAWLERVYAAIDEYHESIWTLSDAPHTQPWKEIAREKIHSQPTLEKVIKAANRELYKRFDYTPDYHPEQKYADLWSVVSGFSEHEITFRGDCEDYALVMALTLARHVESGTMFVMVGSSDDGTHAVLLVRDKDTDYVVDSRFRRVFKDRLPRDFKPRLAVNHERAFAVRVRG